jgi:hypothetical protein
MPSDGLVDGLALVTTPAVGMVGSCAVELLAAVMLKAVLCINNMQVQIICRQDCSLKTLANVSRK